MAHIDPNIIVAVIGGCSSLLVAIVSVWASSKLVSYKIDELQKKVEKHNNACERIAVMEKTTPDSFSTVWQRYDELKERIESIEKRQTEQYDKIIDLLNNQKSERR